MHTKTQALTRTHFSCHCLYTVCLSICLTLQVPVSLSLCVSVGLSLFVSLSLSLCLSLSLSSHIHNVIIHGSILVYEYRIQHRRYERNKGR